MPTSTAPTRPGSRAGRPAGAAAVAAAAAADVGAVLAFAAVGRRSHAEGVTAAGVGEAAWPFLVGLAVGWVVLRLWRAPVPLRRGAVVWVATVAVGLGLRGVERGSVPGSFAVVTTLALGVLLLGWRAVASALLARSARRAR